MEIIHCKENVSRWNYSTYTKIRYHLTRYIKYMTNIRKQLGYIEAMFSTDTLIRETRKAYEKSLLEFDWPIEKTTKYTKLYRSYVFNWYADTWYTYEKSILKCDWPIENKETMYIRSYVFNDTLIHDTRKRNPQWNLIGQLKMMKQYSFIEATTSCKI